MSEVFVESGIIMDIDEAESSPECQEAIDFVEANEDNLMQLFAGNDVEFEEAAISTFEDENENQILEITTEAGATFYVGLIEDDDIDRLWVAFKTFNYRIFNHDGFDYSGGMTNYVVADTAEEAAKKINNRYGKRNYRESEMFSEGGPGSGNHAPGQGRGIGKPGSASSRALKQYQDRTVDGVTYKNKKIADQVRSSKEAAKKVEKAGGHEYLQKGSKSGEMMNQAKGFVKDSVKGSKVYDHCIDFEAAHGNKEGDVIYNSGSITSTIKAVGTVGNTDYGSVDVVNTYDITNQVTVVSGQTEAKSGDFILWNAVPMKSGSKVKWENADTGETGSFTSDSQNVKEVAKQADAKFSKN